MLTATEQRCEGMTLDACHNAIRDKFAGTCGRIDIRWLWSRGDTHRFRVNWWRMSPSGAEHQIDRSEFVSVDAGSELEVIHPLAAHAA